MKSKPKRSGKPVRRPPRLTRWSRVTAWWAIAQKYYGDGSKYPQLYQKNKATIDGKNKGTGNPAFTIYPGRN